MIIPQDAAPKFALPQSVTSDEQTDASPPAYEPPQPHSIAPPNIKPTNYISLTRRLGEVNGTFVLDPTLQIPLSLRNPLRSKAHVNISAFMGEIKAVVYVVGSESLPSGDKTRIEVSARMGSTKLVLHAPERRAPISVSVNSRFGETTLLLPRSFHGPLHQSNKLGEITLSPALKARAASFGNRLFIGEWTEEEAKAKIWPGDEAAVDSALGTVYVGYSDEQKAGC
ncbi:hypothetical protein MSAN_02523300 [Mycena sanguinolenta]|uniref:DUF7330 domain-containing protein n=1 Tax=Mycena sanguinolenta TaxID=230812 RepID=A0A8H6TUP6_9AGAR|nr:hypothetical protein MSAN_02523300 [Mycena sanguinolenta]